jgi:mannosyltransferase
VLAEQWFGGSVALAVLAWLLVVVVCVMVAVPECRHRVPAGGGDLVALAVPWLVLPTALLLLLSRSVAPLWVPRYLAYCAPAAALLLGLAVSVFARWWQRTAVIGLIVALAFPGYLDQRAPTAKDGSDWSIVAAFMQAHVDPGDAVLFVPADRHRSPRRAAEGYPDQFIGLSDIALRGRGAQLGELYDVGRPVEEIAGRLNGVARVWVLGTTDSNDDEPAHTAGWLSSHGWHVTTCWRGPSTQILLATRG